MNKLQPNFRKKAKFAITVIEYIGLLVIVVATVIAIYLEIISMMRRVEVSLSDLLLLFIYLEVLFMVACFVESGKLSIRIPLYIAIVALARYIIIDMKNMDNLRLITVAGTALIIATTVLVIRYGHIKFPYEEADKDFN